MPVPLEGAVVKRRNVVVAEGPQVAEVEPNDVPGKAARLAVPGGISGRIDKDGDVDLVRFHARKGERLIVEVFGRRLGTALDSVLEILDLDGHPLPRAVLRPVTQTEVAFRDHNATVPGIRLTTWNNLAVNDVVLFGREVARIQALPAIPTTIACSSPNKGAPGILGDDARTSSDESTDLQGRNPSPRRNVSQRRPCAVDARLPQ